MFLHIKYLKPNNLVNFLKKKPILSFLNENIIYLSNSFMVGYLLLQWTQVILEVYSAINNANFDTIIFYVYLPMEINLPVIVKYSMACSRAALISTPTYSLLPMC